MWDKIAQCESGGNWSINSGNGYYGGLQFDVQTWLGSGGGAYAPNASLATKAQQIDIANRVYAQRGLGPGAAAGPPPASTAGGTCAHRQLRPRGHGRGGCQRPGPDPPDPACWRTRTPGHMAPG